MAGVEFLVTVASAHAGSPPGRRSAENHRRGGEKGEKNTGFARGFGRRPQFVGGILHLRRKRVDALFGVGLRKTGARRNDARQIGAIVAAQRAIGGSQQQNARDFLTQRSVGPLSIVQGLLSTPPSALSSGAMLKARIFRALRAVSFASRILSAPRLHLSENPVDPLSASAGERPARAATTRATRVRSSLLREPLAALATKMREIS